MKRPELLSLQKAVRLIPRQASLTLGGFDLVRAPMALIFELIRQGGRRLELVSPPNPLALDLLIGSGLVHKATFSFGGFQYAHGFAVGPMWKQAVESRAIDFREVDAYAILTGLRASAMGAPFLPLTDIEGSELSDPERWKAISDPFTGIPLTVTRPIRPQVALLHAQAADRAGNLLIEDPVTDELVAKASERVIASAEKIVERVERPTIPFYLLDAVVEAPRGAWPTACPGHYPADDEHIRLYLEMAGEGRLAEYAERFIGRPA